MKIVSKTFAFDLVSTDGVKGFNVYYDTEPLTYYSPKKSYDVVPGQLTYQIKLPDEIPITEGQYNLGASTFDEAGNESDIASISYFFDLTPPQTPQNLRVLTVG
jgi:hypothetical protein